MSANRHLRPRFGEAQETTTVELFFDLVYVLAVTQLSQLLLSNLSWMSLWHAGFLLLVTWWAWIYTTWTLNWLDPSSPPVRVLVIAGALLSLLMADALPRAFTGDALLFVSAYVGCKWVEILAGTLLLRGDHPLGSDLPPPHRPGASPPEPCGSAGRWRCMAAGWRCGGPRSRSNCSPR